MERLSDPPATLFRARLTCSTTYRHVSHRPLRALAQSAKIRRGEVSTRMIRRLPAHPRPLLEKIASQVKPIMSKRGWKVGTLAEVSSMLPPAALWTGEAALVLTASSYRRIQHCSGTT